MLSEDNLHRYVRALYPVGLLLVLVPLADLTLRSYPAQFGTLQWRFATAGLLLGNYGTILLGAAVIGLAGALLADRRALRILGVASMVMAVVTIAVLVLFALDAVQIRRLATAAYRRPVLASSLGAGFTGLLGTFAWFMLARGALGAARQGARAAAARTRAAAAPLVAAGSGATLTSGAAPAVPTTAGAARASEAV